MVGRVVMVRCLVFVLVYVDSFFGVMLIMVSESGKFCLLSWVWNMIGVSVSLVFYFWYLSMW